MSILIKNVIFNNQKKDILIEENIIKKIDDKIGVLADEIIDCEQKKAVLPGLINCHTHSAMTLLRGYADDLPLKEWLFNKIIPAEEKLTGEDIYWGTRMALIEMIKSGTTFINDMYLLKGLTQSVKAVEETGIRAIIGIGLDDENFKDVKAVYENNLPEKSELVDYAIAPHAIYTASEKPLIWAREFADKNDMLIHMHLSETHNEVQNSIQKFGKRPVNYLEDLGFLDDKCIFAHSIWLNNEEVEILKYRDCSLVYNPCSNMKLASGVFRFEDVQKAGVNICLGTDGSASNDDLDMIEEMKIGALLQKVNDIDPTSAKAAEILKVATINGAKALRKNVGRVKEGALADLILIDLEKSYFNPSFNFISSLVYASNGECVKDVICNGKIVMKDRKIKGEEEVCEKVREISKKFI